MPARQLKLSKTDRMECVRAEARAGISKASKARDDVLSSKQPQQQQQQAKEDDDTEKPAIGLPISEEGPSTTKNAKTEWGYAQPWADTWDRSTPLPCPLKLSWQDHCSCYDCNSPRPWGAGLVQPGGSFAGRGVWNPKELWRPNKMAADLPSTKPAGGPDEGKDRSSSVIKHEVTKPGLKETIQPGLTDAMRHTPTANNSADSLPELARVETNPSPTAQKAKRDEERKAATGKKDALPPTVHSSKEGLVAARGKEEEKQRRARHKETLKKMAKKEMEWMNSSPIFDYESIRKSDLQKLRDELKESNEKLAIAKEVMKLDQALLANLLDTSCPGKKTCTQQDEKPENINKDVAVPASKTDSQAPAVQTGTGSAPQSKEHVDTKGKDPLSDLCAQWDREKAARRAKQAQPCGLAEKLLLAFSIFDLTLRVIMLAVFWFCGLASWPSAGGATTIQTTIVWMTPATMLAGCWCAWYGLSLSGTGGDASERILELVEKTDRAALGVAALLILSAVVVGGAFLPSSV